MIDTYLLESPASVPKTRIHFPTVIAFVLSSLAVLSFSCCMPMYFFEMYHTACLTTSPL